MWGTTGTKVGLIKRVLESEKVAPAEAIYIGDMLEDYRIARETGVLFVGRMNTESFDGLNIPLFPDFIGIKAWVQAKLDEGERISQ